MLSFMRKHPVGVGAGAVVVVAALAWLAFGFFGVHTLFVDDVVDEAGPVFDTPPAAAAPTAADPATADPATPDTTAPSIAPTVSSPTDSTPTVSAPAVSAPQTTSDPAGPAPTAPAPVVEHLGTFESDAHPTSGEAIVIGNGTGQRFLRFENFETDNGPDLNVYLVNSSTGDVSDFIDLGDLKGNIGDQNYEIPVGVDLEVYDEVVIWCVRFGVGFGDARLMTA